MKVGFSLILFTLLLALGFSCKKDGALQKETLAIGPKISINGYTAYDASGNLTASIDTLDWLTNAEIPMEVDSLFNRVNDLQNYTGVSDIFNLSKIHIYPNPFKEVFNLRVLVSDVSVLKLVIVDEYLKVQASIVTKLAAGENTLTLALPYATTEKSLFRMYYQLYNNNKKVKFKGFGDIKKY